MVTCSQSALAEWRQKALNSQTMNTAVAAAATPTKAPPKTKPQAAKKKTLKTKSKKATPAAADVAYSDESGLNTEPNHSGNPDNLAINNTAKTQENTAPADHDVLTHPQKNTSGKSPPPPTEHKCFDDLATNDTMMTQENTARADDNVLIHPEKPVPGEVPANTSKEVVVQAGNNTQIQPMMPSTCLAGAAGNWNADMPACMPAPGTRPRIFQARTTSSRMTGTTAVDSGNKNPTLKFSVKKEPNKIFDLDVLEYHEMAKPPTPPRHRSMSPKAYTTAIPTPFAIATSSAPRTPILKSDLDDRDDDYEATQALKRRAKTWERNHSGRVSPSTESEDEEEDQAMEQEASPELKSKKPRGKQKQKGKQKAVTAEVEADGEEGRRTQNTTSPADLYNKFLQDVDGLATECGKSSTSLHEELHLIAKLLCHLCMEYVAEVPCSIRKI
ncbi:hypothetical protein DFH08DRAFT_818657 [Mycena albidolilacea]|uniref:Uncharacterized protein n=1 Tax=Mycena albidolilacea TaxID=1033008 RepID=A0AAD6ZH36_9AGAR|nr:hypothetical protein DFH08DRAFT_818657 [Mycena albidolilacea]